MSQQALVEKLRKWCPEANEGSIPRVSVVIIIDQVSLGHFFRDSVALAIIIFYQNGKKPGISDVFLVLKLFYVTTFHLSFLITVKVIIKLM